MTRHFIGAVAVLLLVPALSAAHQVNYDFDKTANFSAFKSYAFKLGTPVGQQLVDDRIVAAIEAALGSRGLTKNDEDPDIYVVYHVAFDRQKDISTFSSGFGPGYGPYRWGWGMGWGGSVTSTTQVRDILVGTLIVDIADAREGRIVWRGMGVKEIDTQAKPEKRDKSIREGVARIFKNYPPPKK